MDLRKNGNLLRDLRKAKGLTQKQIAENLGVQPKTVSKWETGHGFPDVAYLQALSELLGVSTNSLLSGNLDKNKKDNGNIKRTKFYVCSHCGSVMEGTGESQIICCGKQLLPLEVCKASGTHAIDISEIENDFYITFNHEMTKEHFIQFIAYVAFDRIMMVRLYPQQDPSVRFPKMYGGKFYYYCNKHGLFEK